jgi:hypothetical protein
MRYLSQEALLFSRLSIFGIVVGIVYWFVSYEAAGTAMLIGFGVASGVIAIAIWASPTRGAAVARREAAGDVVTEPTERIPAPAFAPVLVAAGIAIAMLGLALGLLILPVGVVVAVIGGRYWLEAAIREADASDEKHAEP